MSALNESLLHYFLIGYCGRPKPGPPTQSKPCELGLKARTTCFVPTSAGSRQSLQKKRGFFLRGWLLEPQNVGFERLFEILAQKLPISSAWSCTG
jgi:hypothetical protein